MEKMYLVATLQFKMSQVVFYFEGSVCGRRVCKMAADLTPLWMVEICLSSRRVNLGW